MLLVGLAGACVPRLPGPAPVPEDRGAAGATTVLLPLVRERVLAAHVAQARGDAEGARDQLRRARGLWPAGAPWLEAEAAALGREPVPVPPPSPGALPTARADRRQRVLRSQDPAELGALAAAAGPEDPGLWLLAALRAQRRAPADPAARAQLAAAAAALGDCPRLARLAGDGGAASGYPVGNSSCAPRVAVPDTVAAGWAAHCAGHPGEARVISKNKVDKYIATTCLTLRTCLVQ